MLLHQCGRVIFTYRFVLIIRHFRSPRSLKRMWHFVHSQICSQMVSSQNGVYICPKIICLHKMNIFIELLTLLGRMRKILKSHMCASTMLYKTLNIVILLVDSLKSSVMNSYMFSLIFIKQ